LHRSFTVNTIGTDNTVALAETRLLCVHYFIMCLEEFSFWQEIRWCDAKEYCCRVI